MARGSTRHRGCADLARGRLRTGAGRAL